MKQIEETFNFTDDSHFNVAVVAKNHERHRVQISYFQHKDHICFTTQQLLSLAAWLTEIAHQIKNDPLLNPPTTEKPKQ